MMFCFMKDRKEKSYDKIFSWTENKNSKITKNEKSIIIDFSLASYNSIGSLFYQSHVYGCIFHLGQIVWRRIQMIKFSKLVIDSPKTKIYVKTMLALSFVPTHDVLIVAARLKIILLKKIPRIYNLFLNVLGLLN
ncbi:hypothetical protein NGRA_2828 [Nosema granulosis]|uniref:MULE transposase domain-containing protein n=1 Tax=Nosema granulosis TaxID=83296 RepID=A0A9P6GVX5_9MICR|nr:hypothetical protein NGRA_2828 [Nosema granulosis]